MQGIWQRAHSTTARLTRVALPSPQLSRKPPRARATVPSWLCTTDTPPTLTSPHALTGNVVEVMVSLFALFKNLFTVVAASLLGSILSNLLLVMGECPAAATGIFAGVKVRGIWRRKIRERMLTWKGRGCQKAARHR